MSSPLPPTYPHPTPLKTLSPHLLPHLPHSLPLLRRLQHTPSPAPLTLATFPPTTSPPAGPFAALYADRTLAPETESWLFSTLETQPHRHDEDRARAQAQLLALLYHVACAAPVRGGKRLLIVGTVNECLIPLLVVDEGERAGLVPQKVVRREGRGGGIAGAQGWGVLGGVSVVYVKWMFAPGGGEEVIGEGGGLPAGYRFGGVEGGELGWVRGRSDIPRREETLGRLGCVGVRYVGGEEEGGRGVLVAWAFVGVDGSLTHLFVEAGHRGRGLGKAVARRLFGRLRGGQEEMGFRDLEGGGGEGWADSNVAEDNLESAGVARGLGGEVGWKVRWVGVDLDRVKAVVAAWEGGGEIGSGGGFGGGCQS